MNTLLIYPKFPDTFWSFKFALKFISKKATHPPLGLVTIAAMLPANYKTRLIDMNVTPLKDSDLDGIDIVLISAMIIQKKSVFDVISRCIKRGIRIIAGGPLFTSEPEDFNEVDHLILNEAEITFPEFLKDLKKGQTKHLYSTNEFADIERSPVPRWDLLNMKKYASMSIQYSRGCPYNCEFCNITSLFGHKFRTKKIEQLIAELDRLYLCGWRGNLFFADDNFIGNKKKLKENIIPAITKWMIAQKYPFSFSTQASLDIADDEDLMRAMVKMGLNTLFVGVETPNEDSLNECKKVQNKNRDLISCINKMQNFGIEVTGGFIVGFDNDTNSIFKAQTDLIQKSGIITAMVGLLNAPKGSKLYERMNEENRLLNEITGDNVDMTMNFIPKLSYDKLIAGYKKIIDGIYSSKPYNERVKQFFREFKPKNKFKLNLDITHIKALFKSVWFIGIVDRSRFYYWRLLIWTIFRKPKFFSLAITYSIYGYHFRNVFKYIL
ncbi:MAG: B12-binding domain-containing radical SAM protein [Candidatus Delongbacteria bacterium]|nr:B12-binding domain-containing radical SAM protein [Candidatus Delongbacteria bacterium]